MPLQQAEKAKELVITKIGVEGKSKKLLRSLGIIVGSKVTIMQTSGKSMILAVLDSRVCIDSDVSSKIMVA